MKITKEQLKEILGETSLSPNFIATKTEALNQMFAKYEINTLERICHYLGQVLHETAGFIYKEEIWGNTPAQKRYDTRVDLGNTPQVDGDGKKYKGRGDIQMTGMDSYRRASKAFGVDFIKRPELLATEPYCTLSGGLFWNGRKLNLIADKLPEWRGDVNNRFKNLDKTEYITVRVNGGRNGLKERKEWYEKSKAVLSK